MRSPLSAWNSCSSSSDTLSAPARHSRSDAKSSAVTSWSRTSAVSAAGIMARTVGRCSRSSGRISPASNVRATTTCAPTENDASAHRNEPMCDIDDPGRNVSASVSSKPSTALATIQPSESRLWVTPFAGPVLPDVKKIAAGSRRSTWASSATGAGIVSDAAARAWDRRRAIPSSATILQQPAGERAGGEVVGPLARAPRCAAGAADLERVVDLAVARSGSSAAW